MGHSINRNVTIGLMIEHLPKPLSYESVMKLVSPVQNLDRYNLIKIISRHDRIPAGMSRAQQNSILSTSANPEYASTLLAK